MSDVECLDCHDTGLVEFDIGGGRCRKRFCKCAKGEELLEADDRAREFWDDWRNNPDRKYE